MSIKNKEQRERDKAQLSVYAYLSDKTKWHQILKENDFKQSQLFGAMMRAYQEKHESNS